MAISDEQKRALREVRERAKAGLRRPKLSGEKQEELISRYLAGEGVTELARAYSISRLTVHRYLDQAAGF